MENFKREEKESRKDKFKWLKVAAIAVLFVGTGIGMFYGEMCIRDRCYT